MEPERSTSTGITKKRRTQRGERLTRFVFTVNNFDEAEKLAVTQGLSNHAKWLVVGQEKGESGTPHLQGNEHDRDLCKDSNDWAIWPSHTSGLWIDDSRFPDWDYEQNSYIDK